MTPHVGHLLSGTAGRAHHCPIRISAHDVFSGASTELISAGSAGTPPSPRPTAVLGCCLSCEHLHPDLCWHTSLPERGLPGWGLLSATALAWEVGNRVAAVARCGCVDFGLCHFLEVSLWHGTTGPFKIYKCKWRVSGESK